MKNYEYIPHWIVGVILSVCVLHFWGTTIGPNGKSLLGSTETHTGIVSDVWDGGSYDIVISLNDTNNHYYINRGQQAGLNVDTLNKQLVGKVVAISFVHNYAFLGGKSNGGHVNRLVCAGDTVFNELD